MASDEVYDFTVTTPAGTLRTAPLLTLLQMPSRTVERIEWRVPPGALGALGWQISMRSVPVIPRNAGGFIVAHKTSGWYDLANQPDSGDWSALTYNTGAFPHSVYYVFHCRVIQPVSPDLVLADQFVLSSGPDPDFTEA